MQNKTLLWNDLKVESVNVHMRTVLLDGQEVLRVERDLSSIPFDIANLEHTVDEPTFVKLSDLALLNGTIEVTLLSRVQSPSPFPQAQGFIGLAFRIDHTNEKFESIYLRPNCGHSEVQAERNHTVQYFSYPDFKFDKLRSTAGNLYETYADVGLDEWVHLRLEFQDSRASLYVNHQKFPGFIVNQLLGAPVPGSLGLWVDIGTVGYFKDLRITRRQ